MSIFTTMGVMTPKVRGTVGSSLSRHLIWHLGKSNPIIFGHLVAVLANVHDRRMDTPGPPTPPCNVSMRRFHRHLKIQNPIIFCHLAAVLANVHRRRRMPDGRMDGWTEFARCRDVPELRTGRIISVATQRTAQLWAGQLNTGIFQMFIQHGFT